MVFKPFSHLARQSFAKSLAYGYAQPLVAASQSSYASSPLGVFTNHGSSRSVNTGPLQLHNAFQNHNSSKSAAHNTKAGHAATTSSADSGLDAYYAAWQQHRNDEDDSPWKQFQFPKRLEWRNSTPARESRRAGQVERLARHQNAADAEAASVDTLQKESDAVQVSRLAPDTLDPIPVSDSFNNTEELSSSTSSLKESLSQGSARQEPVTPQSSIVDEVSEPKLAETEAFPEFVQSGPFDFLLELGNEGRYAEVPAVFEAGLASGVKPTATAYNVLLEAAIQLPTSKHQVVVKALDVYFDMLRRGVEPNLGVVTTMMNLLASRSIEVSSMTKALETKKKRFGGTQSEGGALFESNEVEFDLLRNDKSLDLAIRIFTSLPSPISNLSTDTYGLLIAACAESGRINDMLQFEARMEESGTIPNGQIFVSMIEAFGSTGDLRSAVECFNEYKSLAVSQDAGEATLASRADQAIYVALMKAYAINDKADGAKRFFAKIVHTFKYSGLDAQNTQLLRDNLVSGSFIQADIEKGNFKDAIETAESSDLSAAAKSKVMAAISSHAADADNLEIASQTFSDQSPNLDLPAKALLAAHIRSGDAQAARQYWNILMSSAALTSENLVESATMYALSQFAVNNVEEAAADCCKIFHQIRSNQSSVKEQTLAREDIEESLTIIGRFLANRRILTSAPASISLIRAMIQNSSPVQPLLGHSFMGIGPDVIQSLNVMDLSLVLQAQSEVIVSGNFSSADAARFDHLLSTFTRGGAVMDEKTSYLVSQASALMPRSAPPTPTAYSYGRAEEAPMVSRAPSVGFSHFERVEDPYNASTDVRGSTQIVDELERHGSKSSGARLNEALTKFKNIRRAGRHPRYITYAKLISAASRENRSSLVHELFAIAQKDVPLISQNESVRHGWVSIFDAMIGASLTLGDRIAARKYHNQLLELGSAPSANTFGLYITTLKESTKTFDEASEAVKIFLQARSEGVEPTSFLYNALIGKLGKARRIDDCLLYFAEMRNRGIRPTSVTYGTIVNALCRVSDEKFAEEIFDEMESMPNYKPRPAPYNSIMQFFLTTKRDRSKVLAYFERMQAKRIEPTMHTYKLLIDTYATLEPVDMKSAEDILSTIQKSGQIPEAVHYSSLIHAKGCVAHDIEGARQVFDSVISEGYIRPQACLYQALFEAMVANHCVEETDSVLESMKAHRVEMTPYIANTLIHGWALKDNIVKAKEVYDAAGSSKREPSTYEAMTRAFLAAGDKPSAITIVQEMMTRGYPSAVSGKILELVGGRTSLSSEEPNGWPAS